MSYRLAFSVFAILFAINAQAQTCPTMTCSSAYANDVTPCYYHNAAAATEITITTRPCSSSKICDFSFATHQWYDLTVSPTYTSKLTTAYCTENTYGRKNLLPGRSCSKDG